MKATPPTALASVPAPHKIMLIHPTIRQVGIDILSAEAEVTLAENGREDTLIETSNRVGADAMIIRVEHVTRRLLAAAPGLKVVGMHGVGTDTIDVDAATEAGVLVLNAPLVNFRSTAEHTLSLLMAVAKTLFSGDRAVRSGDFAHFRDAHLPMEIDGRSIFVIGLGRIGSEVARKCRAAFNMRVMAYDPLYGPEAMKEKGVEWVPMEKGYAEADFVTVHVPLKADTRGMIDAAAFAKMKPGAIFLNLSRGPVVEQAALIAVLESGHLAGAGLDVFEAEPVSADDPVTRAPNLVLSPHYAGDTLAARNRASSTIARSVLDALDGQAIEGLVNPAVLERSNCRLANKPGSAGKCFRLPVEWAGSPRQDGNVTAGNGSSEA